MMADLGFMGMMVINMSGSGLDSISTCCGNEIAKIDACMLCL
jgi:hypothetical protein